MAWIALPSRPLFLQLYPCWLRTATVRVLSFQIWQGIIEVYTVLRLPCLYEYVKPIPFIDQLINGFLHPLEMEKVASSLPGSSPLRISHCFPRYDVLCESFFFRMGLLSQCRIVGVPRSFCFSSSRSMPSWGRPADRCHTKTSCSYVGRIGIQLGWFRWDWGNAGVGEGG